VKFIQEEMNINTRNYIFSITPTAHKLFETFGTLGTAEFNLLTWKGSGENYLASLTHAKPLDEGVKYESFIEYDTDVEEFLLFYSCERWVEEIGMFEPELREMIGRYTDFVSTDQLIDVLYSALAGNIQL
jgi:hypothetical protein